MYKVYGIPNCNTVKKTLDWLKEHKTKVEFHDYKKESISKSKLKAWCQQKGWEALLNKKSATWRALGTVAQSAVINEKAAIDLMASATSIIKRPVIEKNETVVAIGFDEKDYQNIFG